MADQKVLAPLLAARVREYQFDIGGSQRFYPSKSVSQDADGRFG
ncbi:MAG: hypothetical protein ABSE41_12425 [Bacteroidota bacterium]